MRKIQLAYLHTTLFVRGMDLGRVLPPQGKTFKNFAMTFNDQVLSVTVNDRTILVPSANIQSMLVEEEAEAPKPTKAKAAS